MWFKPLNLSSNIRMFIKQKRNLCIFLDNLQDLNPILLSVTKSPLTELWKYIRNFDSSGHWSSLLIMELSLLSLSLILLPSYISAQTCVTNPTPSDFVYVCVAQTAEDTYIISIHTDGRLLITN